MAKARDHIERLVNNHDELELVIAEHMMFRQAIECNPLPFALFDPNDILILWNDAYRDLHLECFAKFSEKVENGTLRFQDIIRCSAPKALQEAELEAFIAEQIHEHKQASSEWSERYYDGPGWYSVVKYATPSGAIGGFATNIDKLKRREEELDSARQEAVDAQERFRAAISILDDGFVIFDKDDKLQIFNDGFKEQFGDLPFELKEGLTYEEMTLHLAKSGLIPGIEGQEEEFVARLVKKRKSEEGFSNTFQRHDGRWIRQRDKRTSTGDLVGIRTDITELKEKEQEIRAREELITSVMNASENGILVTKEYNELVVFNDSFLEMFSIDREFVDTSKNYEDLLSRLFHKDVIDPCVIEGFDEDTFVKSSMEITHKGEIRPQTIFMADGRMLRYTTRRAESGVIVHSYIDITEEIFQLRKLEEANKQIETAAQRHKDTTNAMAQGLIVCENNKVINYNAKAVELLCVDEEMLFIGQTVEDFCNKQAEMGYYGQGQNAEDTLLENMQLANNNQAFTRERKTREGRYLRIDGVPNDNGTFIATFTDVTAEKERELEIARTSNLLSETTDAMAQGLIVVHDNQVVRYNQQVLKMLGIGEETLFIGQTPEGFLLANKENGLYGDEEQASAFVKQHLAYLNSGKPYQAERITTQGRHIKVDAVPNDSGGLVLTYTDMTELKVQQLKTEKTSKRLFDTATAMSQGMVILEDNKIEFFNEFTKDVLNLPEDILCVGTDWFDLLKYQYNRGDLGTGEIGKINYETSIKQISSREDLEYERSTLDGRYIRINGSPSGTNGWLILYSDITEIRKREDQIKKTSELLLETTQATTQGMVVLEGTKIEFLNDQAIKMLDLDEDVLFVGNSWENIVRAKAERQEFGELSEEEITELIQGICDKIKSRTSFELEKKNNKGRVLQQNGGPCGSNGWLITYTDITEIKAREASLKAAMRDAEAAERAKSEFLANMSHEIRTPMNGVMGMAELLSGTSLDAKQKMFTDVIVKSGASLLTIINDILDFSKIDAGQMELHPEPFNLAEAIEDVATLVSSKAHEKQLDLNVRINPAIPQMIIGDVGRIRQIITNLLGNAVKFTEEGNIYVNVDGETRDSEGGKHADIVISVKDTGIGIPEEKCAQVFQKFSQVDTSATRKHEGTGLGLSIASSLVKLMNGEIHVESKVGEGSTFWFKVSLPIDEESVQTSIKPQEANKSRVLIVDKSSLNHTILKEQLNSWNFDNAAAESGKEALDVMHAVVDNGLKLDLALIDCQLPDMSGSDLLETMRADPKLKDIPVVIITSISDTETHQKLIDLGAIASLTKPTRSSVLHDTIIKAVEGNKLEKSEEPISIESKIEVEITSKPDEEKHTEYAEEAETPKNVLKRTGKQLDVLVAEDNEVNQIVVREILQSSGLEFDILHNGKLILERYMTHQPKVILMDISMPEMNGKEATKAIREFEVENGLRHTPIICITAHALKGDMESFLEVGMDDYISKPVSPIKLMEKINCWLDGETDSIEQQSA